MKRLFALALAVTLFAALLPADSAWAKKKKKKVYWQRQTVNLVCDTADTTVTVLNSYAIDVEILITLSDASGSSMSIETAPAGSVLELSCASLGVTGLAVATLESRYATDVTAIYQSAGSVQVLPIGRRAIAAKRMPDLDDGDSDSDGDSGADSDSRS